MSITEIICYLSLVLMILSCLCGIFSLVDDEKESITKSFTCAILCFIIFMISASIT